MEDDVYYLLLLQEPSKGFTVQGYTIAIHIQYKLGLRIFVQYSIRFLMYCYISCFDSVLRCIIFTLGNLSNYTPQKILRATTLFSIYHNVKAPKLKPYLMDIPKDAE